MNCPHCQTVLPPQAKFCFNCGQPQTPAPEPIKPPSKRESTQQLLQKFISPEFARKLADARANREGRSERRIVTILFCDVKGSTAMAEQLDPEEWAEVMNGAFEYLIEPIYRYEGTVVRLLGDAVLAFFGAPVAHEDDPHRAVLAGLAMLEGIETYRDQVKRERGLAFDVRIGLNTGLVVVGEIGSDLRAEYTVMGDAVNLAARMEQTARPGTVQLSGYTHKLVAAMFEFESLGEIEVKGKDEPVPAYRVLGQKLTPESARGVPGLLAPLIGRQAQLSQLQQAVIKLQQGQGQIVSVIGEAGLGKSRLVRELRQWVNLTEITWSESRGISFDTTHPYRQFQQHVRNLHGLNEHDSPEIVQQKVIEPLKLNHPEKYARYGHIIEMLLGVATHNPAPILEGEAFKRELFAFMPQMLARLTNYAPTVLVFEDLHWADAASVELLLDLFTGVRDMPILFLCLFRPDPLATSWQVKEKAEAEYINVYTEIPLTPLSPDDTQTLINSLLTISDLPAQLHDLIRQKADGNPFFTEEIIRTLLDSRMIVRDATGTHWEARRNITDVAIPDNLQALLMARIDRLPETVRYTLQRAAVIGRIFVYKLLQAISSEPTALPEHLALLMDLGLVRQGAQVEGELTYIFHHVLTQEAAYQTILLKERRQLHRQVGLALAELWADRLEDNAPILAHHFHEANELGQALHYYTLAGEAAFRLYARAEALTHYNKAIEIALATFNNTPEALTALQHLYLRRGRTWELNGQYEAAETNYQELQQLAEKQANQSVLLAALLAQTVIQGTLTSVYNYEKAERNGLQALTLARQLGDEAAEAKALWALMLLERMRQQGHKALMYGEASLAIARRLNLREQLAYTLNDLEYVYMGLGKPYQARQVIQEARQLWQEFNNVPMLTDNLGLSSIVEFVSGNYDMALSLSQQAYQLSVAINNQWGLAFSRMVNQIIYYDLGHIDEALAVAADIMALSEKSGLDIFAKINQQMETAWMQISLGLVAEGKDILLSLLTEAENDLETWGTIQIYLARTELILGNLEGAEVALQAARSTGVTHFEMVSFVPYLFSLTESEIELARGHHERAIIGLNRTWLRMMRLGFRPYLSDILRLMAHAMIGQARLAEAEQFLLEAKRYAEIQPNRRIGWQILWDLSHLKQRQGDMAEADTLRQKAQGIILYITEHISEPRLREAFLQLPAVRGVMTNSLA